MRQTLATNSHPLVPWRLTPSFSTGNTHYFIIPLQESPGDTIDKNTDQWRLQYREHQPIFTPQVRYQNRRLQWLSIPNNSQLPGYLAFHLHVCNRGHMKWNQNWLLFLREGSNEHQMPNLQPPLLNSVSKVIRQPGVCPTRWPVAQGVRKAKKRLWTCGSGLTSCQARNYEMAHLDRQSKQCVLAKPTLHRQFQLSLEHDFKTLPIFCSQEAQRAQEEWRPHNKESSFQRTTLGSRGPTKPCQTWLPSYHW